MSKKDLRLPEYEGPAVYRIVNNITGEFYVGGTSQYRKRIRDHYRELDKGKHCNENFTKSWEEYGREAFCYEVLEELKADASREEIRTREQVYIDELQPSLNINKNAFGWDNDLVPVAKLTLTDRLVAKYPSVSAGNLSIGKHPHDRGITATITGRQGSNFGYKWVKIEEGMSNEDIVDKSKEVSNAINFIQMFNLETGELEDEGRTLYFEAMGHDPSAIYKVLSGEYKHHHGKFFRYYEPFPEPIYYLGLDSGLRGGIVLTDLSGNIVFKTPLFTVNNEEKEYDMPRIWKYLNVHPPYIKLAALEEVFLIFGSSKATAFKMGAGLGMLEMALVANDIDFVMPKAKEWQKECCIDKDTVLKKNSKSKDTKATALKASKRLFPKVDFTKSKRATTAHDGMVDAALIAKFAQLTDTKTV